MLPRPIRRRGAAVRLEAILQRGPEFARIPSDITPQWKSLRINCSPGFLHQNSRDVLLGAQVGYQAKMACPELKQLGSGCKSGRGLTAGLFVAPIH